MAEKQADENQESSGVSIMDSMSPELRAKIAEELGGDSMLEDFGKYFAKKKLVRENRDAERWGIYLIQNDTKFSQPWKDAIAAGKVRMAAGDDLKDVKTVARKAKSEARKVARKEAADKAEAAATVAA